ncbi:MAG: ABC transporter ATP-binding protein [Actinomycetota bacterium]
MATLQVEHLNKAFPAIERRSRPTTAIEDLSFDIGGHVFVSVVGPSGCGKSTLLNIVSDIEEPTSGTVSVSEGAREARLGYVFQDPRLLPWRTVMQNMLYVIEGSAGDPRERATTYLRMVGLEEAGDKFPSQLSGGMQQRVGIARAFSVEPDLLLMDEPFSALDAITRDEMNLVLMKMWEEHHRTALFVTHSIREAVYLADRVLVMSRRPGRIIEDIRIPFARPRGLEIGETVEFNEICGYLRSKIQHVPH